MNHQYNTPPSPTLFIYQKDTATNSYIATNIESKYLAMPERLRLTTIEKPTLRKHSPYIIQSPFSNGYRDFQTRLYRIKYYQNIFTGDSGYNSQNKNLIIFEFSANYFFLLVHFFNGYYPESFKRKNQIVTNYLINRA
jgi:hypothetical protein